MKTTLDLPDDLMREVKIRAVMENRKLKEAIADLLRRRVVPEPGGDRTKPARRVTIPLVQCSHEARPGEEMTPERVAKVLLEAESEATRGPVR